MNIEHTIDSEAPTEEMWPVPEETVAPVVWPAVEIPAEKGDKPRNEGSPFLLALVSYQLVIGGIAAIVASEQEAAVWSLVAFLLSPLFLGWFTIGLAPLAWYAVVRALVGVNRTAIDQAPATRARDEDLSKFAFWWRYRMLTPAERSKVRIQVEGRKRAIAEQNRANPVRVETRPNPVRGKTYHQMFYPRDPSKWPTPNG